MSGYVRPSGPFLKSKDHPELYRLEEERNESIHRAAKELGRVLGHPRDPRSYWERTMPEALLEILESFDTAAGVVAAQEFLERNHGVISELAAVKP